MVHCLTVKLSIPFVAQYLGLYPCFQSVVLCLTALVWANRVVRDSVQGSTVAPMCLFILKQCLFFVTKCSIIFSLLMLQPFYFGPLCCTGKAGFVWVFVHMWREKKKKQNAVWSRQTQQLLILRKGFGIQFSSLIFFSPTNLYVWIYALTTWRSHHYLNVLNDEFELRWPFSPCFHQFHGIIKILHVLSIHLEERS